MQTTNSQDSSLQAGADGSATSTPVSSASVQPNSQGTPMTVEDFRRIAREEADKSWQSGKDRRFDQIGKEQQRQGDLLARIEAKMNADPNLTIAQAKREAQVDMLLEPQTQSTQVAPVSQGSGAEGATSFGTLDAVLDLFGVSESTPGVLDAMREANGNPKKLHAGLLALRDAQAAKPTPTPAANAASATGSAVTPSVLINEKIQEYESLMNRPGNDARLSQLKRELDAVNWGQT